MTILESSDQDPSLMRLWSLITELSEQLNQNREISTSIYSQAGGIKVRFVSPPFSCRAHKLLPQTQAVHSQTGFVLRR
jgi:hypothetical protein